MLPSVILHPSRQNPIAASPNVDLPAPDSPISPSTSPRYKSRSIPFMISIQLSSLLPLIWIFRICSRISPCLGFALAGALVLALALAGVLVLALTGLALVIIQSSIFQATSTVKHPVHHKVDSNCQERNSPGGNKWSNVTKADQIGIIANHGTPISGWRLKS